MISEEEDTLEMENSRGSFGNMMLVEELRKKILTFRDFIDLPPCGPSGPIHTVSQLGNITEKPFPPAL